MVRPVDLEGDEAICGWVLDELQQSGSCSIKSIVKEHKIGKDRARRLLKNCLEARDEEGLTEATDLPAASTPTRLPEGPVSVSPASGIDGLVLKVRNAPGGDILDSAKPMMLRDYWQVKSGYLDMTISELAEHYGVCYEWFARADCKLVESARFANNKPGNAGRRSIWTGRCPVCGVQRDAGSGSHR